MYLELFTCISNKLVCLENQSVNFFVFIKTTRYGRYDADKGRKSKKLQGEKGTWCQSQRTPWQNEAGPCRWGCEGLMPIKIGQILF